MFARAWYDGTSGCHTAFHPRLPCGSPAAASRGHCTVVCAAGAGDEKIFGMGSGRRVRGALAAMLAAMALL